MPRLKRQKMSRSRSNKSRQGRKRRVDDRAESPVKKHSKTIAESESPIATDPCVCDRGEPENCLVDMVETTRELENSSMESEIAEVFEDRGIFLPFVLPGFQNQQNAFESLKDANGAPKKRSADDAELDDSDRSNKRRSLDFRMNSLHISPTKNQMVPWHLLHGKDDSRISRRYPERYWVPNEWVESLDYR